MSRRKKPLVFSKVPRFQAEAEQIFFNEPLMIVEDAKHNRPEPRFHALKITRAERRLHIRFNLNEENLKILVLSARYKRRKEWSNYDDTT